MVLASRGHEHDRWVADLKILDRRMSLINWATGLAVTSAVLTCLVVVLLFAANLIRTHLGTEIAWLFMASMLAIGGGVRGVPDRDDRLPRGRCASAPSCSSTAPRTARRRRWAVAA